MIKFCISSNKAFYDKTYPILVNSLIDSGVPKESIYFFIGGFAEYKKIEDQINVYQVDHNSFDFTALISVIELNLESDYWFLLHDTCKVGKNFYKNVTEYDYTDCESVSTYSDACMNIGAYSWDLLQKNSQEILRFKNTDYSESSLMTMKAKAVEYEDFFLKPKTKQYLTERITSEPTDYYNGGTPRKVEYFPGIDLYKIKANWEPKSFYEISL